MATHYGFHPSDWLDDFFLVECRFRAPPDDDLLRRLGRAAGRFPFGALDLGVSGPFAVLDLFPHPHRERDALSALAGLLASEAGDALVEAVVVNSIQEDDGERPADPGPAVPGSTRPIDPSLPDPARSPVFEAAVAAVLAEQQERLLAEFLDRATSQPVRLRALPVLDLPAPPPIPDALRGTKWHRYAPGTGVYRPGPNVSRVRGVDWPDGFALAGFVAVRGQRALLAASTIPRRHLRDRGPTELLLLEGSAARAVYRLPDHDEGFESAAWLADDLAVIGSHKRTIVVALADGTERASASGGGAVTAACGGRVIASRSTKSLRLSGWIDGALVPLARYVHPDIQLGPVIDDLPTVRIGERCWIPDGIEQALAAIAPARPKKKATASAPRKKKPTLDPFPFADLAPEVRPAPLSDPELDVFAAAGLDLRPASPYKQREAFRAGDVRIGLCADGVAFQRGSAPPRLIRWTSPSGYRWQLSRLRLMDDRVFASDGNTIVEADLEDTEIRKAFDLLGHDAGYLKDLEPVTRDELSILGSQGLMVVDRREGNLAVRGFVKIVKPTHFLVSTSRGEALVGSEGKQRIVLVGLSPVQKLASFTEDADDLRSGPAGFEVADRRRGLAWRIRS